MSPEEIAAWRRPYVQDSVIWLGGSPRGKIYQVFTDEAEALRWLENGSAAGEAPPSLGNEWRARRLLWRTEISGASCIPVHYVPAIPAHLSTEQ